MAKRLKITKNKNSEFLYIIDDYIHPDTNKRSTFVVERLGNIHDLKQKYNTDSRDEVINQLKNYINDLRISDEEDKTPVSIELPPSKLISPNEQRVFNIGYLYIKNMMLE